MSDSIKSIRKRIDALDRRLVELVSARARLAQHIGKVKSGPIYRPEREAQVLRNVLGMNRGPLSNADAAAFQSPVPAASKMSVAPREMIAIAAGTPPGCASVGTATASASRLPPMPERNSP